MKSENRQAMETLAALRFLLSSGLTPITKENAEFMAGLIKALDTGIAAINQIESKEGEK